MNDNEEKSEGFDEGVEDVFAAFDEDTPEEMVEVLAQPRIPLADKAKEILDSKELQVSGLSKQDDLALSAMMHSQGRFEEVMVKARKAQMLPSWVITDAHAIMGGQMCIELGMRPMTGLALLYRHPLSNQITLTARGAAALLQRAGWQVCTVRDMQKVFATDNPQWFYLGGNILMKDELNDKGEPTGNKIPAYLVSTACTTLEFFHKNQLPGTRFVVSFTREEATAAGINALPASGKPGAWQKYEPDMVYARALGRGSRRFCADAINGMYLADELDDKPGTTGYDGEGNVELHNVRRV